MSILIIFVKFLEPIFFARTGRDGRTDELLYFATHQTFTVFSVRACEYAEIRLVDSNDEHPYRLKVGTIIYKTNAPASFWIIISNFIH